MSSVPMIGIVGGAGPMAGFDLAQKITAQTIAQKDQDHLPVILVSKPYKLDDRTAFLLSKHQRNPALAMSQKFLELEKLGATVAAIPCNTAHAPQIFDELQHLLQLSISKLRLVNMVDETLNFIKAHYPQVKRAGVLSTNGTYRFKIYANALEKAGIQPILPTEEWQEAEVQAAIYHPEYGLKSTGFEVHPLALSKLNSSLKHLTEKEAELIILGCSEIPLAISAKNYEGVPLIDPTWVLARAMIRESYPHKLKPLNANVYA